MNEITQQISGSVLDMPVVSAIAAAVVILLTAIHYWIKNRNVLSGPTGVPYFGLYPFLTDQNAHLRLEEYKNRYGDVFSFTYTGRLYINLGSVKAMRELLVNKSDCFGVKFTDTNILVEMLKNGLSMINGDPWKILRKFFVQRFRDYGLNTPKDNIAGSIYDSLAVVVEDLKSSCNKPIDILELLGKRSSTVIRKIVFGENGVSDEEIKQMLAAYGGALEGNGGVNLLLIGPIARFLFKIKPSFKKNFEQHHRMATVVLNCCKRIEQTMNEDDSTCIVEDFYKERNERCRNKDPSWKNFSDDALVESLLQFVGDGIMAVADLISRILNTLAEYPDEQEKIYSEIMEVIGPNREPVSEDKMNMPYTNAFISEYMRIASFIHFFPSLECTRETYIKGYRIPKGSIILLNFYSTHHDPETFVEPDTFNPSRYLPSPGKAKAESHVTFGIGKRSCAGESFVMLQTFLFLTTIVKNFKIVSSNVPASNTTWKLKLTFVPRDEIPPLPETAN